MSRDPNSKIDYKWDWSTWLATGETITAHQIIIGDSSATPIAVETSSHTTTTVTARITGGTLGSTDARATCRITTSTGQIEDWTLVFSVAER